MPKLSFFTQSIAMDLGTANTIIMQDNQVIIDQPSVVAIRTTDLPLHIPVSYQEIAFCLDKNIQQIEAAIKQGLGQTPSELYADIVERGIYLTGGGALLHGLAKRLTDKFQIQFHVADDPLHSVAKGTCLALENTDNFSFLIRN